MTKKERLFKIANKILTSIENGEIDPNEQAWHHIEAYKTNDLIAIYERHKQDNEEQKKIYLHKIEPSLQELNEFAYSNIEYGEAYPDWLLIAPLKENNIIIGYSIMNAYPFGQDWKHSLIDVFSDEETAKEHVRENWFLDG